MNAAIYIASQPRLQQSFSLFFPAWNKTAPGGWKQLFSVAVWRTSSSSKPLCTSTWAAAFKISSLTALDSYTSSPLQRPVQQYLASAASSFCSPTSTNNNTVPSDWSQSCSILFLCSTTRPFLAPHQLTVLLQQRTTTVIHLLCISRELQ